MKHYFIPMMLMAAAAFASCEKTNLNEQKAQEGSYVYTISAVAPDMADDSVVAQAPATRTDYTDAGVFSWSAGDAISVLFHNGDVNKFFTLTTTESGAAVKFTGSIEAGYEIGASDGDTNDKKIWALFPASANHTFQKNKANTADSVRFYVQPSVDFSTSHFSANIPMYDLVAAEDATLSFKNMASTYKFIVTGIKDGVSKVAFTIHNQNTYGLSGAWPIDNSEYFVNYGWASPGSANSTLTYVSSVTSNQAVFYVSSRYYANFLPEITVSNYSTGVAIKTFTASTANVPHYMNKIQPITLDVSEANGGNYYAPAITIDGDLSDWDGISAFSSSQTDRIKEWKFKSDAYNVYFYFKLRKNRSYNTPLAIGFNTDNDTATGDNYDSNKILGNETIVTSYPFTNAKAAELIPVNGYDGSSSVKIHGGSSTSGLVYVYNYDTGESLASDSSITYIELSIPRSNLNLPAAGNTITIGCAYDYYVTGTQSITLE